MPQKRGRRMKYAPFVVRLENNNRYSVTAIVATGEQFGLLETAMKQAEKAISKAELRQLVRQSMWHLSNHKLPPSADGSMKEAHGRWESTWFGWRWKLAMGLDYLAPKERCEILALAKENSALPAAEESPSGHTFYEEKEVSGPSSKLWWKRHSIFAVAAVILAATVLLFLKLPETWPSFSELLQGEIQRHQPADFATEMMTERLVHSKAFSLFDNRPQLADFLRHQEPESLSTATSVHGSDVSRSGMGLGFPLNKTHLAKPPTLPSGVAAP